MPGYVIHLAVAEEYLRKHQVKEDYNEFINGIIFPDGVKDKSETHYGNGSSEANLELFLKDKKIDNSFNRGYFMHLLTDYLFYNRYVDRMSKDMYNDYDLLNAYLMEKYNVTLPDKAKTKVSFKSEGNLVILSKELVVRFIDEVSNLSLDEVAREVKENPDKWTKFRKLNKF